MADDNDLVSENAQLRRELEGFRRQQAGVVHPAIAQNENAAAQQWNAADQEIKRLEKQHSELLSEGKFEESAALQKTIAAMANRVIRMVDGRIAQVVRNVARKPPEELVW